MAKQSTGKEEAVKKENTNKPKCGIIMPISAIDNCSAEHWAEVLLILRDIITSADFDSNLVSDADDSGIIQKRIIQNLYSNEIVICDVSGKNPNVMFELGMRLAFDKPTIIIKDDKTDYSFDTSIIEHLTYPRDLRFSKIVKFKEDLKIKLKGTFEKSTNDSNYSTFLKNFGEYKVTQLAQREISSDKYILNTLEDLRNEISLIRRSRIIEKDINRGLVTRRKTREKVSAADKIVAEKIDLFVKTNKLTSTAEIFFKNKANELFEYLEDFDEVRDACESSHRLREIMNSLIEPPSPF